MFLGILSSQPGASFRSDVDDGTNTQSMTLASSISGAPVSKSNLKLGSAYFVAYQGVRSEPPPYLVLGPAALPPPRDKGGGFSPHPGHEPSLLSTLSAIQIAILLGRVELLGDAESLKETWRYVLSLQLDDGSFRAREAAALSEGDCRFTYAALCALALLGSPAFELAASAEDDASPNSLEGQDVSGSRRLETSAAVRWLLRCPCPSEKVFTSPRYPGDSQAETVIQDRAEGGLNGRPGKSPDVCYTWWTLATAELLVNSLSHEQGSEPELCPTVSLSSMFQLIELRAFVVRCMSPKGGLSAHPGEDPDPFHTFFGLAGLSLIERAEGAGSRQTCQVAEISPMVALPCGCLPHLAIL
ncbi:unnamed protein product [Polarella glacialis]|uniref:Geranylgeranyl transferase type II subunit beta n=1 Tax=Polarella glacialis TaxID=89957 RepID=A0A813H4M6_POLGL|nr:unnamed protein product [Polarella glacialis]